MPWLPVSTWQRASWCSATATAIPSRIAWSSALRFAGLEIANRTTPSAGSSMISSPGMAARTVARGRARPSSAPRDDQACLVRDDDELRAVARAELGEQARQMGLDGERRDDEELGDLRVGEPAADEPEDLALARGQGVERGVGGGRRVRRRRDEGLDEAPRDARCEQRLAAGHDAHGGDEVRGLDVLEQES